MSSISARKQQQMLAEELSKDTSIGFSKAHIECLQKKFNEETRESKKKKLDRAKFRDILHNDFGLTEDILMDRIFRAFDEDNDGVINMEEWIRGVSIFLHGDLESKVKFTFKVYDLNSDGYISKEEMYQLLKSCLVKPTTEEDPEEHNRDIVDLVLKLVGPADAKPQEGKVSYEDFKKAVMKEELLLEVLGTCLPSRCTCRAFKLSLGIEA